MSLNLPRLVEHQLRGLQVEVNRPASHASRVEPPIHRLHQFEERNQRRVLPSCFGIASGQDVVDRGVGRLRVRLNHAVVQLVANHRATAIDLHQTGLHEPVDTRVQTAQPGR